MCPFQATPALVCPFLALSPTTPIPSFTGTGRLRGTHLLKGAFTVEVFGPQEDPAVPEAQLLCIGAAQVGEELPDFIIHPAGDQRGR